MDFLHLLILLFLLLFNTYDPPSLFTTVCYRIFSVADGKVVLNSYKWSSMMIEWMMHFLRFLIMSINKCYWLPLKDPVLLWYHTIDCCLWWSRGRLFKCNAIFPFAILPELTLNCIHNKLWAVQKRIVMQYKKKNSAMSNWQHFNKIL